MERINLNYIEKKENTITYNFSVSEGLSQFFSGKPFKIEYPENIEEVPDAIAAIPFVCNVLPVVWMMNCELHVKELDEVFWGCIPEVKKGYETMYSQIAFAGNINIERIVPCDRPASGEKAVFFSGGLDAVNTLLCHMDEHPTLISIWGADIRYENIDGWEVVHKGIKEYAEKYGLTAVVIRSTFRQFDNESNLHSKFCTELNGGWWYCVKHGIGLLGHAAPYAYLHGVSNVYIASSNCSAYGQVKCASDPLIDNQVRYANVSVTHDSFELSRQDKVHNVVDYVTRTGEQLALHVCWESQLGGNCCRCEKCYRTMTELIAEGVDPVKYGFFDAPTYIPHMKTYLIKEKLNSPDLAREWQNISKRLKSNRKEASKLLYWNHVKWMIKTDFYHLEKIDVLVKKRIRNHLAKFKFYQVLHKVKAKYKQHH